MQTKFTAIEEWVGGRLRSTTHPDSSARSGCGGRVRCGTMAPVQKVGAIQLTSVRFNS